MKGTRSVPRAVAQAMLLLAPIWFVLIFLSVVDLWLNPVTAMRYLNGTLLSEYTGSPKAGNFMFVALPENGRRVEVNRNAARGRLAPGSEVCIAFEVRMRVNWRSGSLVGPDKCSG